MVYYIYKNFTNPAVENHVKGIVVLFSEYMNNFPISIVCGRLNESPSSFYRWGIYWLALDNKERLQDLNGKVISLNTVHDGMEFEGNLFAKSLSEIESAQDVKDKIIKRLIEL